MRDVEVKIIVSDKLITTDGDAPQLPVIVAPAIIFKVDKIPAALPLGITFIGTGLDDGKQHEFSFRIIKKDNQKTLFQSPISNISIPVGSANFVFSGNVNILDFQETGRYHVIFTIDNADYEDHFYIEEV